MCDNDATTYQIRTTEAVAEIFGGEDECSVVRIICVTPNLF